MGPPVGQQSALLPLSTMDVIKKVPGVAVVVPTYRIDAAPGANSISFGPGYTVINKDPNANGLSALQTSINSGRDLNATSRGEVVLGVDMAKNYAKKAGDTINLPVRPNDAPASFVNHPFTVVGVLAKTGTAPDSFAYVSNADSRMLLADSLPPAIRSAVDTSQVAEGFTVYGQPGATLAQLDATANRINKQVPVVKATPPSGPVNARGMPILMAPAACARALVHTWGEATVAPAPASTARRVKRNLVVIAFHSLNMPPLGARL